MTATPNAAHPGRSASLLSGFARYETSDPGEVQTASTQLLSPHRLTVYEDHKLSAFGRCADLGDISLCYLAYGAEVSMDRPSQDDYVAVLVPLRGSADVSHAGDSFVIRSGEAVAVVSPGASLHTRWSSDCRMLLLRVGRKALERAAAQLAPGLEDHPVSFAGPRVTGRKAAAVAGTTHLVAEVLDQHGTSGPMPRPVARALADHVLGTLLLAVPNSATLDMFSDVPAARCPRVRVALDMLASERSAEYTIADLADAAGVSVRALELGFRRELDTTPAAYMRNVRLAAARQELLHSDPFTTSVTEIALKWGFAHVGRFAARYREQFGGEAPSTTLNRVRVA